MDKLFLKAGNPLKIANAYSGILTQIELDKIANQSRLHASAMYTLGLSHYRFALSLNSSHWRQKVSRLYYASYNVSKAVRFNSDGVHSTEVKDHTKVGNLPDNFPNRATYENVLSTLRDDRNSCDYDHMINASDLVNSASYYSGLVKIFIRDAHDYLSGRGVSLGRKI